MLKVSGLSVKYGAARVVDNVSFTLAADEILTLVGPTGCGKTTILNAIAGLVPIAEGEIELGQWKATTNAAIPPEQRNVGMVFQDFALFPHLSVMENVAFRLKDRAKAGHWLALLGLDNFRNARPGTLSGGEKQRVALARTLAHEPALVLLDEPLSNLDAALKDSLRREIRDALKAAAIPAVWVTHDQEEALSVGDRLGVLRQGRLEQLARPEICFCQPVSRFVASFLGEASFVLGQSSKGEVVTCLGAVSTNTEVSGEVDILLRPDDLSLAQVTEDGNGEIVSARYEGGSWLYMVRIDEGGAVQVRTNHENQAEPGSRVSVRVISSQPLAAFERDK